ncbi:MAG: rhodanese-like domain-containing protein, partial [Pseudomonadota bacterium]
PHPISAPQLWAEIFGTTPPVILDVRVREDLDRDPGWIPSAQRVDFQDVTAIQADGTGAADVVVMCQGGLKLSQGVASRLAARGRKARFLEGGVLAWRAAGLPIWRPDIEPNLWVSGWDRSPSRAAALWLAARLLPRPHEIMLVAPDQIDAAAPRFEAAFLPDADALLALLDRPVPAVAGALAAGATPVFERLSAGHATRDLPGWRDAVMSTLDALVLGHKARAAA